MLLEINLFSHDTTNATTQTINKYGRLNARRGDLRARPHGERDLRLLAVVDTEALEEQAAETRACAATARIEDHEP